MTEYLYTVSEPMLCCEASAMINQSSCLWAESGMDGPNWAQCGTSSVLKFAGGKHPKNK